MKPSQSNHIQQGRPGLSRLIVSFLAILAACTLVFVFMPSAKETRVLGLQKKLAIFLKANGGRVATEAEVKEFTNTNNFVVRKLSDAPSLYLIVPSLNNNIAVLGRLYNVRPGIDGYAVHIIPTFNYESPTTTKAVGMCLLKSDDWKPSDLIKAAPNIRSNIPTIDEKWSKIDAEDKAKINDQLRANEKVRKKFGDLSTLVVDGKRSYLLKDWFKVSELLDRLKELHRQGG